MPPEAFYVEPVQAVLRRFVEDFRNIVAREAPGQPRLDALRAPVEQLLDDRSWIGDEFLKPVPGETATWALYRSQEPDLCIFTMVVPPLQSTKIHNHLTDGWVGLVQGAQIERHFRRFDDGGRPGVSDVRQVGEHPIAFGEITPIQHPDADIHQIVTTSREASVSLHVLCNDLGTVERQTFDVDAGTATTFVSGYTNIDGASFIGR
jgi:predicted metal-dependent enzyme (double-stranded beta helix superfamily)